MKQILFLGALLLFVTGFIVQPALIDSEVNAAPDKVDANLWQATNGGPQEFLIVLAEQADLSGAAAISDKTAKGQFVYDALRETAVASQAGLRQLLDEAGVSYRPFFIHNMVWAKGDAALLSQLAQRGEVFRILPNTPVPLDQLTPPVSAEQLAREAQQIEWGVSHIGADAVWNLGYTGSGIIIGAQDTGYDWDHPALLNSYRGWDGSSASHDYNWHDAIHAGSPFDGGSCGTDSLEPCDDHGHGTHTLGTMVGNDLSPEAMGWPSAASNAVGVAPGAQWIGCRNMDIGNGTPATYAECYEWFIAPYPLGGDKMTEGDPSRAPHVINNSWGCPPSEGCIEADVLQSVVEAVTAAGIVTVHSAGNGGLAGCGTVSTPAAIYEASLTVGSVAQNDLIASSSSRGPVTVDGSQRLKPDVVAPGVGIRSSTRNGGYGLSSGTSMAAPHVAGLVALLLEAAPELAGDVTGIRAAIAETAVPLTTTDGCGGDSPTAVPNHTYGNGRVDAYQAIAKAVFTSQLYLPFVNP